MLALALSLIAVTISILANVPQLVRLHRVGTGAGLSLFNWQVVAACGAAWVVHGGRGGSWTIVIPNAVMMVAAAVVVGWVRRERALSWARTHGLAVVFAATMIVIDVVGGPVAYAIAAFAPGVLGLAAQARDLIRSRSVAGVSIAALVSQLANNLAWLAWASVVGEPSVVICAAVMAVAYGINTALAVWRRSPAVVAEIDPEPQVLPLG